MGQAIAPRTLGRDARCDSGTYAPRRLVRGHLPDSLTFRSPTVFHSRTNSGRLTGRQAAESVKVGRKRGSMMVVRSSVSRNTWFVEGLRQKRATFGSVAFKKQFRKRLDCESADGHAARIQVSAVSVATLCTVANLVPVDACAPPAGALRRSRRGMNRSSVALLSIHLVFSIIAGNLQRRLNV